MPQETIFRVPIDWIGPAVMFTAGLIALTAYLFRTHGRHRWRALIFTTAWTLVFTPAMLSERLVVSNSGIEDSSLLMSKGFNYNRISYVHVTTRLGGRNQKITVWEVHYKPEVSKPEVSLGLVAVDSLGLVAAERVEEIELGTLWEAKTDTITRLLKGYGVVFR